MNRVGTQSARAHPGSAGQRLGGIDIGTTRPSVIERARKGDASEFVRLYGPLAYVIARKRGLREHDAEDVMQQTVLELLQLLPSFQYDRARGTFKGLVKTLVLRRTVDLVRSRQRECDVASLPPKTEPKKCFDELFEREWRKSCLMIALDRVRHEVKPTTFQSFQLFVLWEWPIDDVARSLGLTKNQVSQNKRRVTARLKAHVEGLQRDAERG